MNRLRYRLLLLGIAPLFVILLVVIFASSSLLRSQVILSNLLNDYSRQALLASELLANRPDVWQNRRLAQDILIRMAEIIPTRLILFDPQGELIASSDSGDALLIGTRFEFPNTNDAFSQGNIVLAQVGNDEGLLAPIRDSLNNLQGYIFLSTPFAEFTRRTTTLVWILLLTGGAGLLLGVLLALGLTQDIERPLKHLSQTAYTLALGIAPPQPIPEDGPQELKLLARTFNAFLERLQTLETSRKRLLANLVHELGTPLGALISAVQALLSGAAEETALRDELLQGMDQELRRLKRLTDELTHLHNQAFGAFELHYQTIHPTEWLSAFLAPWAQAAREKHQQWQVELSDNLPSLNADADRLAQALGNIIHNAIRYTPSGGKITIQAFADEVHFHFIVCDNGPGISPDEQSLIFEPFQRGSTAQRFPQGMGLGLTIARDLIHAHGGHIEIESIPGRGSCFKVRLPLHKSDPNAESQDR
ncbi:HAMP domain-containing sensor histidine kinase [Thermanaerothrix sp.]|jgi:two-component system sensor histidine kinase BaeS|uniref:HAMP domain-containing sensor histidine kinase n=1 Tax=Thermanaerothrix sp. TaxID=2972675 RepID=UPI002ADE2F0B|nr:HAMP domain-containing sensor histidine kinase [Thermanaerothrix sp.]